MTSEPYRLNAGKSVRDALDLMNKHRIGAVLIVNDHERLVGIFTERDFLRRSASSATDYSKIPIIDWMSPQPYTIHPDAGWEEAVSSMERLAVRHLPVVEGNQLVGIVTSGRLISKRAGYLNEIVSERTQELKRANDALLARDAEVTYYMKSAAKLQKRLVLPRTPPDWPEVSWGIHFAPLDPLGGDYYDFTRPDEDHLGVLIADASGHGIPAAMVAIMTRMAFAEASSTTIQPGEVLAAMNRRLLDLGEDQRFVTAFYGLLNRKTREFTFANAGHPFPLRYNARDQKMESLTAKGFILGITGDEIYREKSVILEPGDRLVFFTDGAIECNDDRGESYGLERLTRAVMKYAPGNAGAITTGLIESINQFRNKTKATDDTTIVVASIH